MAPNETIEIEIEWSAKIPRPFSRTGYIDDYYFFGQWFPKLGVLEDAGWNTHQFHSGTEFYSDYGVYDVRMTVPRGFVVGASGREVSVERQRERHDRPSLSRRGHPRLRVDDEPAFPRADADVRASFAADAWRCGCCCRPEHAGQEARHFAATAAALKSLR